MFDIPYLIIVGRSNESPQPYTRISFLYGHGQISILFEGMKQVNYPASRKRAQGSLDYDLRETHGLQHFWTEHSAVAHLNQFVQALVEREDFHAGLSI